MSETTSKNGKEFEAVNKIYELIKSRSFLQDLYEDLISDMKEKPTYKLIKDSVTEMIDDSLSKLKFSSSNTEEEIKTRKTNLQNISILAFTVDKVIFDVLYKRLEHDFRSIIGGMVKDIHREKANKGSVNGVPGNNMLENIEEMMINHSKTKNSDGSALRTASTSAPSKGFRPAKLGRPRKNSTHQIVLPKDTAEITAPTTSTPKKKRIKREVIEVPDEEESENEDYEEDGCSDVSSVPTRELSSFEDGISVGSGDEENGGRKLISLRTASEMFTEGTLSEIYQMQKDSTKNGKIYLSDNVIPAPPRRRKTRGRPPFNYPSLRRNSSSLRIRSSQDSVPSPRRALGRTRTSSPRSPPKARRGRKPATASSQRYSSSDLYKPRPVFGSHAL